MVTTAVDSGQPSSSPLHEPGGAVLDAGPWDPLRLGEGLKVRGSYFVPRRTVGVGEDDGGTATDLADVLSLCMGCSPGPCWDGRALGSHFAAWPVVVAGWLLNASWRLERDSPAIRRDDSLHSQKSG